MPAASQAEDEVSSFLRRLFFFMKECVGHNIDLLRASVNRRSATVVEMLCSLKKGFDNSVSGVFLPYNSQVDVSHFLSSRDILPLLWFETVSDRGTSDVLESDKIQSESS